MKLLTIIGTPEAQSKQLTEDAKIIVKQIFEFEYERLLEDCDSHSESVSYGDTSVISGYYISDSDIDNCYEEAKLRIKEEFEKDSEEFFSAYEGEFDYTEILNFINQL